MGWQAGSGLGRHGQGQTEPVPVESRPALAGLGAGKDQPPALPLSQQEKRKNEIWKKTRKRFKATPLLEAFAQSSEDEEGDSAAAANAKKSDKNGTDKDKNSSTSRNVQKSLHKGTGDYSKDSAKTNGRTIERSSKSSRK
jgi:G-patch domain